MFVAFSSSGEASYSYDGGNWLAGSITYAVSSPTLISEIGWNGVYWLVGGNGTHTSNQHVWKSYDGINWTPIQTVTSTSIYSIFWTGKFWFLSGVTSGGVFKAISTNFEATSWNVDTTGLDVVSIAYNGKVFVAASDATSNAISWSYDAINWISLGNGTIFDSAISRVKWMGDRFVALGSGTNRMATSRDGIRWTAVTSINSVFTTSAICIESDSNALHKIKFPENVVFSGNSYSRDSGVTWATSTTLSSAARTVGFNGTQFIYANLSNGNSYVGESVNGPLTQINIKDLVVNVIRWNGSYWLLGGSSASGANQLLKSADGYNWTSVATGLFTSSNLYCNGLAWNGSLWVVSGRNNSNASTVLGYSTNGTTWTSVSTSIGGGPVEWNSSYFLCGGLNSATNTNVEISSDGKTWSSVTIGTYGPVTGITWSGKSWVIVTAPSNTATTAGILYSADGVTWTPTSLRNRSYVGTVWSGLNYVAVDTNGAAVYSNDGVSWYSSGGSVSPGLNVAWTQADVATVKEQLPTIIGGDGTNTMLYSTDGLVYTGLGKSTFSVACRSVAWNGNIWVAGGEGANTLAYSYDGKRWTGLGNSVFSGGCNKVISNGTVWVALGWGTNTIAKSTDGMVWTGLGTSVFDASGISVDWNGSQWLAVGSGTSNRVATSSDATSWTGLGNSLFSSPRCVKWALGSWYVGADASGGSTIAKSTNTSSWTYVTTNLTTVCRGISWNGREVVAVGNGTNTIVTSVDGQTWNSVATTGITSNGVEWNGKEWIFATSGSSPLSVAVDGSTAGNITRFDVPSVSSLLTNSYCVGANSGVGTTVFNSRIYLNAGNKLVIYGPEVYDSSLMSDTSISLNMNLPV
jgi:hypothetical protein